MTHVARRGPDAPFTLMGVWAHPDDETYLSAVLMRRVVRAGGRVVVVTATRGEHGAPGDEVDRGRFALRRERELRAALAAVGVHELVLLGHPDGACDGVDDDEAVTQVAACMERVRPDLVVTFGPDGVTGHPDHVACGRWATRACLATGGGGLLYAAMTDTFAATHTALHAELGMAMTDELETVPDADVSLHVHPTPIERRAKWRALDAHASQSAPIVARIGRRRFHRWWTDESFRPPTTRDHERFGSRTAAVTP